MLMLFGGHETTTNLIASSINLLCRHPDAAERLRRNPEGIDRALEEVMRFDGPSNSSARIVAVEHTLGTKLLKPGQRVFAMIAAANRDPAEFTDPDRFDIGREQNRHLTFGVGRHFCIGSNLARMEGRLAVTTLLKRIPSLALVEDDAPERLDAIIMRGFKRLPVRLG
jgi:cytochrome P450